jgi:hypothetical protein
VVHGLLRACHHRLAGENLKAGRRHRLEHLKAWRAAHPDTPVLLLGDLNSLGRYWDFWRREDSVTEIERQGLECSLKEYNRMRL